MKFRWWKDSLQVLIAVVAVPGLLAAPSVAGPPAQRLPSALLAFQLVQSDYDNGGTDTRLEIVNLSGDPQLLQCFYVQDESCNEVGFFVSLTPFQPIAWLASNGFSNTLNCSAVPPFFGRGEMKCAVVAPKPDLQFHNTIQGRATVFATNGRTVSYSAVGFQRLSDGDYSGVLALNGIAYAQCPDKLHFDVLADTLEATSDLILVPCSEDLLTQTPTSLTVQFQIINEFETSFSTSINVTCISRTRLGAIADTLNRATLGSDTAHVVVRGSQGPLLGLVIDGVPFGNNFGTAGNEPSYQGGRSATVTFP